MLNLVENIRKIAFARKTILQHFFSVSLSRYFCFSILSLTLNCIERNHSFVSASFIGFETATPHLRRFCFYGYFHIVDSIDYVSTLKAPIHVTKPITFHCQGKKYYYDFTVSAHTTCSHTYIRQLPGIDK